MSSSVKSRQVVPSEHCGKVDAQFFLNLVDRTELANRLSLSPSYISKLMKDEGLPYFKIGRAVRFKMSEVVEFLSKRRRP
ncbi:MAG: helix-turn-helix transcriptional regulator [Bdellovibrionales bacterium]